VKFFAGIFVGILIATVLVGLFMPNQKQPNLQVQWSKTVDWNHVVNGTNYIIEFGFGNDGLVHYRYSDERR
jgi:ABC-type multidrug transport system permease subunit